MCVICFVINKWIIKKISKGYDYLKKKKEIVFSNWFVYVFVIDIKIFFLKVYLDRLLKCYLGINYGETGITFR